MIKGIVSIGILYGFKIFFIVVVIGNVNKVVIIVIIIFNFDLFKNIVNVMVVNIGLNLVNLLLIFVLL